MSIVEHTKLIDYGSDIVYYPNEKIHFNIVIDLLRIKGYSPRYISNNPAESKYKLIPSDGLHNIIILTKGKIEFHYTMQQGKKENERNLEEIEANIEAALCLDGE